ncbi:hypothetical protein LB456_02005 [Psychroflexus sp. CAK57W]|uniref:hypothetical protein n=1 Tax=Psychroflexus curvus TaxID=2873595 RepID=UPI001CCBEC50|nr:hypothetical protein [Psychroflexus curvus]MBZ9627733.1 hypothetical protein [Psychroflexus curvus]MBZ9786221.1 hypothetical protein [Psychroflexus curvus]
MKRGEFLRNSAFATGTLMSGGLFARGFQKEDLLEEPINDGVFSATCSFRVAKPIHKEVESKIKELVNSEISQYDGFLGFSLKQMVGDSTMVKNLPASYKGALASAFEEGAESGSMPYVYLLLVRFNSFENLKLYGANNLIKDHLSEVNFMYSPNGKTDLFLEFTGEPMVTIAAGNREKVFSQPSELKTFLNYKHGLKNTITVANHVSIKAKDTEAFEEQVKGLLSIAQNTFKPHTSETGLAGAKDNSNYKKAVTTEILRGAKTHGDYRNYIMHGVWESYWDHENSHLDQRFKKAAAPVGSYVVKGPVETFYKTILDI